MEIDNGLLKRAENLLRYLGTSDLPRKIGDSGAYVARETDQHITEGATFSFMSRTYKVGELVTDAS